MKPPSTSRQCFSKHAYGWVYFTYRDYCMWSLSKLSPRVPIFIKIQAARSLTDEVQVRVTHQVVCVATYSSVLPHLIKTRTGVQGNCMLSPWICVSCGFIVVLEVERPGSCPQSRLALICPREMWLKIRWSVVFAWTELPFQLNRHPVQSKVQCCN